MLAFSSLDASEIVSFLSIYVLIDAPSTSCSVIYSIVENINHNTINKKIIFIKGV